MSNLEGEIALEEAGKVGLIVKTDLREVREVKLVEGARLGAVVEIIARERGVAVEELMIVREGEDAVLAVDLVIGPDYPYKRRHHVHHRSVVNVIVFYGAKQATRVSKRHDTVDEVLDWAVAVKEFGIDSTMAAEFVLVLHGQKEELPGDEHIGHLAGREKELKLDLVRGDIANG
jgi:hypothetical protein